MEAAATGLPIPASPVHKARPPGGAFLSKNFAHGKSKEYRKELYASGDNTAAQRQLRRLDRGSDFTPFSWNLPNIPCERKIILDR
nr:hypothetical protein [uncultured Roseococcus sp.]